jgi:hypothetical protein
VNSSPHQLTCVRKFAANGPLTVTVTETIITTGTVMTTITPLPASTRTSSAAKGQAITGTAINGRVVAPTTGVLALDCPGIDQTTQFVSLAPNDYAFNTSCGTDINGDNVDIMAVVAYSYYDCLMACASFNRDSDSSGCAGVEFNADMTNVVANYFGTCWLKKFVDSLTVDTNSTNLNLHVAGVLV